MAEEKTAAVRLELTALEVINFALQQNKVPVIRDLRILNETESPLEHVELVITSEPAVTLPFSRHFDYIGPSCTFRVGTVDLAMDGGYLSGLTEKTTASCRIRLIRDGAELYSETKELTALAFDEWHGYGFCPEMLAAFVTPNHPEIAKLTARAADLLGSWTKDPSLDGYQTQDPNRVLLQAAAVYGALQEQNIVYAVPPASFEPAGQRVRLCDAIMQQKMGTCLDLSLLYAGCLEAMGLHPLLIIKPGHIFAGVWLEDLTFPESVQDDASLVTKRLASGINEIAVVECTAFTSGKNMSFDLAKTAAEQQLQGADSIEYIIDVNRARLSGISPLPQRIQTENGWQIQRPAVQAQALTAAPKAIEDTVSTEDQGDAVVSKKMQWERKLLDLGLRNNLINMRLGKSTVPVLTSSLDELENTLADGSDFTILARPADFSAGSVDFETMHDLRGNEELIQSEFKNNRLRSVLTDNELSKALKELYRSSKTALEENGANTLYLALGLLRWYETPRSTKARYAPIILLPVEIVRKSARAGYVLRLRDDEPQMNVTMLEKLKQDFRITVSGLDPLPVDDKGIDTRKVFTILRKAVMNQKRWDVLESAYLGIFSFSQFVMWNDIRNRSEDLAKNKVVRSLMDGKLCWEAQDMVLGDHVPEEGVFLPVSADASQLFAIEAASGGSSFVLHGPPGTGKSQTITALIANALAQGKTVLFVAEKMAALEVVQRRLAKIGLGPFCLELHSNKSKKRDVLEQLRLATEVTKQTSPEEYAVKADQIASLRSELNDYAASLHHRQKCGKTLHDLVNGYEENRTAPDMDPFPTSFVRELTGTALSAQDTLVERLVAAAKAVGHPHGHPLQSVCCTEYSQQIRQDLPAAIRTYEASLDSLETALPDFSQAVGESVPADLDGITRLAGVCGELTLWKDLPRAWAGTDNPRKYFLDLQQMARHYLAAGEMKAKLSADWKEEFFTQDGKALAAQWDAAQGKWFLARMMGQSGLVRQLNSYSKTTVNKDSLRSQLSELVDCQAEQAAADALYAVFCNDLGNFYNGKATDWQAVLDAAGEALRSCEVLETSYHADAIRREHAGDPALVKPMGKFREAWERYSDAKQSLYRLLALSSPSSEDYIAQERALCRGISDHAAGLKEWIAWNGIAEEAANLGLGNVVDAYRGGTAHNDIQKAYRKAIYKALAIDAIDADRNLRTFSGAVFNEKIRQFKRIDEELTALTQQEIFCRLAAKIPNFAKEAAHSSELGILQRAIRSGGRGLSIRKLFEQIPNLLPKLCPCMLMSPISAAQYLDPKREPFDLVVFDEASQLPTCKAVGALARGENAIIVGDPKQMPPTAFFATNTVDEENLDIEDLESILDDCLALNMPQTHLLWHYRSRHESLIAFSNAHFYENKLYTFPSVNDRESKVRLIHVDGVFERGKLRQNRAEAMAIVEDLKRRCHDETLCKQSVGVVTFNISQQNLIDDLVGEACKEDPALENWAFHSAEPLFIKNLENVQGDERDVILFSVGYGPDEKGKVYMNFGPLNRDGGWRRLNVAITRARQEMTVFSTLRPDQIDLTRTTAEGVAALRAFLEYADNHRLPQDANTAARQKADAEGIADSICDFLEEHGYATDRSVGHSEYRMDIGVLDPENPERYILGILLDGDSYGAAKTARDREIAQIGVLNGLGWQITRVWTMDWWDNSQAELDRILALLTQPRQEPEPEAAPVPSPAPTQALAANTPPKKAEAPALPVYKCAVLKQSAISAEDFLLPKYTAGIRKKAEAVIAAEAPISKALLTRRILQSYGISRAGSRIQNHLDSVYNGMNQLSTTMEDQVFYWSAEQDPAAYRIFRTADSEENRRDARDIPIQEAANALCHVLMEQISLSNEDLIREAAKLLGYSRLGSAITALLAAAIEYASAQGRIIAGTNGNWVLPE